jgi:ATP-binding cassette subfamily B protein/subfamily B ATP-binding cassette protein MsbA
MNHFCRALKLALAHRVNVALCIASSLMVAVLWAGNLTAVWPVIDVIMNDSSLPDWVDQQVARSEREVADSKHWLTELNELSTDDAAVVEEKVQAEIAERQAKIETIISSAPADGQWSDARIAERTHQLNTLKRLESLRAAAPKDLRQKLKSEKEFAQSQVDLYETRVARFSWLAPYAHRWLPTTPFRTLVLVCAFVFVATFLKAMFRVWNSVLVSRIGNQVSLDMRNMFFRQILRLDMAHFTEQGRGDLMNRCTSDLGTVGQGVQRVFGQALLEPLKMFACLIGAAFVSWQLLLLTIISAPVAGYTIHWLGKALKRTHKKAMQELSSIFETLSETLSGMKLIKSFTMEPAEQQKFHESSKTLYRRQMKIVAYNSLVSPLTETLGLAMVIAASLMGGFLVLGQNTHILGIRISDVPLTHGDMALFFAMLAGMADPARRLSNEFGHIQSAAASADRVYEVLDMQPKITDPPNPQPLPVLSKSIVFDGVDFAYNSDKQILHGIRLEVRAGEKIAVVGPNGCGKTTFVQLLPRLYDPTTGRITIDGVDIRDVRLRDLRSRFGMVTQETLLFNDTVASNIAHGKPDASRAEIEAAARQAHAHGFITEKLPNGYDSIVGTTGSRLSGGQRQRIALARAILRNPEVLILDEATSQIDVESEQLIHNVLEEFIRNRTTFLITHRPSTIALADRVVVMDMGQIIDVGAPSELAGRCDLYRRLCVTSYHESAA